MDEVIKQAPENMKYEDIEIIYNKNDKNVLNTLIELWDVQEKSIKNITETQCKWEGIRELCDDYDKEMDKFFDKAKNNNANIDRTDVTNVSS
jgi:hypothetical protein